MKKTLSNLSWLTSVFLCANLWAFSQSSTSPTSEKRFYERVAEMRQRDPNLVRLVRSQRELAPEMNSLKWLLGTWKASAKAFPTPSTPERFNPDAGPT